MLNTVKLWLRKAAFVSGVFILTAVSTSASAADTCTSVVGNLMLTNNCGFDSGTTSWTPLGGVGLLSTSSAGLGSPTGNPFMVITPDASAKYNIRSATFNLLASTTYNVRFVVRADTVNTTVGTLNIIGVPGALFNNVAVTTGIWTIFNFNVTPTSSGAYQFAISNPGSNAQAIDVDGFVIIPVPEPASMLLLGSLCSAVVGYKYRRKTA